MKVALILSILTTIIIIIKEQRENTNTTILHEHQPLNVFHPAKPSVSLMLFLVKVWLSQWKSQTLTTLSVQPGVCRKSIRHFSDDHRQVPLGYHWIPGLSASISPSDEKRESRGTRCSEVCCSCPLRLTRVTHLPWFSTTAKKPSMQGMKYLLGKGVCEFWKCSSVCTIASKGFR